MATRITSTPGLLEREDDLRRLRGAIERARDGAGGLVLVQGPAGVGKTRLLARVRSDGAAAGLRVLVARGATLERSFAFGVARQLFEAQLLATPDDEREALLSGAARLSERLFGEAGLPLEARGRRGVRRPARATQPQWEMYDLETDRLERTNLAYEGYRRSPQEERQFRRLKRELERVGRERLKVAVSAGA
jgi:hypothetical protein